MARAYYGCIVLLLACEAHCFYVTASSFAVARAPLTGLSMAGFGGSSGSKKAAGKKAAKPAAAKLSMKRQWDRFNELVGSGQPRIPVFARIPGEQWTAVGDVACAPGVAAAAGVQLHKRFILEHAARVSPSLALKAKSLEAGFTEGDASEPSPLEKVDAADATKAGFEGAADPSARYKALSNIDNIKKMDESSSNMAMGGY